MVILLQETKIGYWSWNLEPRLIRICRIRWWLSFYCFLDWKHTFWINLVRKFKHVSLSWNSTPSLFRIWKVQWWCYFLELFCKFCSKNPLKIQIKKIHWRYLINFDVTTLSQWFFLFLINWKEKLFFADAPPCTF